MSLGTWSSWQCGSFCRFRDFQSDPLCLERENAEWKCETVRVQKFKLYLLPFPRCCTIIWSHSTTQAYIEVEIFRESRSIACTFCETNEAFSFFNRLFSAFRSIFFAASVVMLWFLATNSTHADVSIFEECVPLCTQKRICKRADMPLVSFWHSPVNTARVSIQMGKKVIARKVPSHSSC